MHQLVVCLNVSAVQARLSARMVVAGPASIPEYTCSLFDRIWGKNSTNGHFTGTAVPTHAEFGGISTGEAYLTRHLELRESIKRVD